MLSVPRRDQAQGRLLHAPSVRREAI